MRYRLNVSVQMFALIQSSFESNSLSSVKSSFLFSVNNIYLGQFSLMWFSLTKVRSNPRTSQWIPIGWRCLTFSLSVHGFGMHSYILKILGFFNM